MVARMGSFMSRKHLGLVLIALISLLSLLASLACTSSSNTLQTNPSYNKNFGTQTRTPEKYGNPKGQYETSNKTPSELPVSIMQISLEVGQIEVNQPYNVYALVSNPSSKDVQYEWTVTSGKLLPVLEEDREHLASITEAAKFVGAPPETPSGLTEGVTPETPPGEKTIDGKVIPGAVNPDEAVQSRPTPSIDNGKFKEGEPVPPPQIQALQGETDRTEPRTPGEKLPSDAITETNVEPPSGITLGEVIASSRTGNILANSWLKNAPSVRYAVLALEDDADETQPVEIVKDEGAEGSADISDESDEDGTGKNEDEAPESAKFEAETPGEGVSSETTAVESKADDSDNADEGESKSDPVSIEEADGEAEPADVEFESEDTPTVEDEPVGASLLDREATEASGKPGSRLWPTPWETFGDDETDLGSALINDIQSQIQNEIDTRDQEEALALESKTFVSLTTDDPFIRWIPDTAENVTISLTVVNNKGVPLTEPTALDCEVLTPQPKVELEYEMPENGLEPGDTLDVAVNVKNIPDYRRSLLGITFDLNNFDIGSVELGNLFDGGRDVTLFYAQPDRSSGLVTVAISLDDIIRSVRGSGKAFTISFEARMPIPPDMDPGQCWRQSASATDGRSFDNPDDVCRAAGARSSNRAFGPSHT